MKESIEKLNELNKQTVDAMTWTKGETYKWKWYHGKSKDFEVELLFWGEDNFDGQDHIGLDFPGMYKKTGCKTYDDYEKIERKYDSDVDWYFGGRQGLADYVGDKFFDGDRLKNFEPTLDRTELRDVLRSIKRNVKQEFVQYALNEGTNKKDFPKVRTCATAYYNDIVDHLANDEAELGYRAMVKQAQWWNEGYWTVDLDLDDMLLEYGVA